MTSPNRNGTMTLFGKEKLENSFRSPEAFKDTSNDSAAKLQRFGKADQCMPCGAEIRVRCYQF